MRVCHISTVHTPFDQRIFHRECWSLAKSGYEVHLLVQFDQPSAEVEGVHVHSLGPERRHTLGLRVRDRISRIRKASHLAKRLNADLYHLHDPELIPLGLWLKMTTGALVVFDCHENNTAFIRQKRYLNPLLRGLLIDVMSRMETLAGRSFDAIVTADQGVARLYRSRFAARRVETIHNFPRLDLFPATNGNGENGAHLKTFDLVYHGTIPRYHLEVSFDVAEKLRERGRRAKWLFFGKCPEADWAQQELVRRGLEDDFEIESKLVPHNQVADRVRQARIGFIPLPDLPKFQDNIPTKLFEFMGLGMPTILSDLPPSRPFVGDGQCAVMVRPDDTAGYAEAIESLLEDPERAKRMGAAGIVRTRESCNWEKESLRLLGLYKALSEEHS